MAFTDELTIYVKAGRGGDGVVRWLHEKNREFGGPVGGNGGNGGNVYVVAVRNAYLLSRYKVKKEFVADRGQNGKGKGFHGTGGNDLVIELPVGSIITNTKTDKKISLFKDGERVQLLKGGRGGRGNKSYKSFTNRTPEEFTPGAPGEEAEYFIEVELIADIGLIGLPNAGKTSLLNALTNANAKVGAYPFTTLEPNLGEIFGYIISDIPGLIEGAAHGKGRGHKFLRHVRRTKFLVHLVSLENEDLMAAYQTVRNELKQYDASLAKKKEFVVLTKTDLIEDQKVLTQAMQTMKRVSNNVTTLSIHDETQVKALRDLLLQETALNT